MHKVALSALSFPPVFSAIINRIVVTVCYYKLSLCDLARALRVYRRNDLTLRPPAYTAVIDRDRELLPRLGFVARVT